MFDQDLKEERQRFLLNHPESECLFEVFDQNSFEHAMHNGPCDDVTNESYWEELFKQQSSEKFMEQDE